MNATMTAALEQAFLAADSDFLTAAFRSKRYRDGLSGACAVVCQISAHDMLTTAWAGDCRAIVGRQITDLQWQTIAVTEDHSVSNPTERARLIAQHPGEKDVL